MTKQEAQQTLCKLVGEVSSKLDPNRDKPTCICNLGRYKNNDVDAEAIAFIINATLKSLDERKHNS